jgi:hypothetical protein
VHEDEQLLARTLLKERLQRLSALNGGTAPTEVTQGSGSGATRAALPTSSPLSSVASPATPEGLPASVTKPRAPSDTDSELWKLLSDPVASSAAKIAAPAAAPRLPPPFKFFTDPYPQPVPEPSTVLQDSFVI